MKKKKSWKIIYQMYFVYVCAFFIPILIIGSAMLGYLSVYQTNHYSDLLKAYSDGNTQTLYEITNQIYTISDSIVYNDELIDFLTGEYANDVEMRSAASETILVDKYAGKYVGIDEIRVYIDREDMVNYGQFHIVTDEIRNSDWYKKACEQYTPFWFAYSETNSWKSTEWYLTLVRKMVLVGGDAEAVIMIKVRGSYIGSRIDNSRYLTMVFVDDQPTAYSNDNLRLGTYPILAESIDLSNNNYSYSGTVDVDGAESLICVDTLKLSKTANRLYLVSYDTEAEARMRRQQFYYMLVVFLALVIPFLILVFFAKRFTKQVGKLQMEMKKASSGKYAEMEEELAGSRELFDAYEDLKIMVKNIQRMEAEQYEIELKQKNLMNDQQRMEIKVLSSQINPHFLYNTLETIRMNALTAGNREVANAIKLLGKSMRYVLENTGVSETTIQKELDHVINYIQIQQYRFGDRVNYQVNIMPDMDLNKYRTLPLLFQPIVENAIIHGLESRNEFGKIWIAIYIENDIVKVDISDNGCGIDEATLKEVLRKVDNYTRERNKSSIGLYNINRRIKLSYGDEYGISILSTVGEGTRVTLNLPILLEDV